MLTYSKALLLAADSWADSKWRLDLSSCDEREWLAKIGEHGETRGVSAVFKLPLSRVPEQWLPFVKAAYKHCEKAGRYLRRTCVIVLDTEVVDHLRVASLECKSRFDYSELIESVMGSEVGRRLDDRHWSRLDGETYPSILYLQPEQDLNLSMAPNKEKIVEAVAESLNQKNGNLIIEHHRSVLLAHDFDAYVYSRRAIAVWAGPKMWHGHLLSVPNPVREALDAMAVVREAQDLESSLQAATDVLGDPHDLTSLARRSDNPVEFYHDVYLARRLEAARTLSAAKGEIERLSSKVSGNALLRHLADDAREIFFPQATERNVPFMRSFSEVASECDRSVDSLRSVTSKLEANLLTAAEDLRDVLQAESIRVNLGLQRRLLLFTIVCAIFAVLSAMTPVTAVLAKIRQWLT